MSNGWLLFQTRVDEQAVFMRPAIAAGALLGGPVAAGILFSNNFKALDNPRAARTSLVAGLVVTAGFFFFTLRAQSDILDIITNPFYPLGCLVASLVLFEIFQREDLQAMFVGGAQKGKWSFVAGMSLAGILVSMLIMLPFLLKAPPFRGNVHRLAEANGAVYFTQGATRDEARILGEILKTIKYFTDDGPEQAVQLEKVAGGGYNINLEVERYYWDSLQLYSWMEAIEVDLERFYGADVKVTVFTYAFPIWNNKRVFDKTKAE